jgi:hypothetical protein
VLLVFCLGCATGARSVTTDTGTRPSSRHPLIGTWESASLAYDLIGTTLIFAPDGAFTTVIGVMLSGTYRVAGNALTVTLSGLGEARVQSGAVRFSGGEADVRFGSSHRHLVPITRAVGNSLVGQWLGTQDDGVISYEEYTSDGRIRLRFPSHVGRGRYELTGDTTVRLRMTSPPSAEHIGVFRIHADTLRTGPRASDIYLRARPLIPATIEQPKVPIR